MLTKSPLLLGRVRFPPNECLALVLRETERQSLSARLALERNADTAAPAAWVTFGGNRHFTRD